MKAKLTSLFFMSGNAKNLDLAEKKIQSALSVGNTMSLKERDNAQELLQIKYSRFLG